MSSRFVVTLGIVVVLILAPRFLTPVLPLRRFGRPMHLRDALLTGLGIAGLTFHCAAMFFRSLVATVSGTSWAIDEVNTMGTGSKVWFATFAGLAIVGLRRQHSIAIAILSSALAAVGITMYDGDSLSVHLSTIFVTVVVLAAIASALVLPQNSRCDRG
jgi:hypothetical protein